jgi:tight adherence protein B
VDPLILVIAATVLVSVFTIVVGLRSGKGGSALEERLTSFRKEREGGEPAAGTQGAVKEALLRKRSYSGVPLISAFVGQFRGSERAAMHLEQAGVPLRVGEYYIIRYVAALVCALLPFLFSQGAFAVLLAVICGGLGYMLPAWWVGSKKGARQTKMNGQLVEMLGMVANSLKSGYGLMQSFEFASNQLDAPLATELKRMVRDANLGMSGEEALTAMGERISSPDLDMVLTAINIQRSVGGNLAEILQNVAFTMRERERIRGEISTLTSQQRMTGIIIGALPIGMGAIFMLINPDYMGLLFTTTAGRFMLMGAVGLEVLGVVTIKRILAIDI